MSKTIRKKANGAPDNDPDRLVVTFANGEQVAYSISDETRIPSNPDELVREAAKAPQQYGTWADLTATALRKVRNLEYTLQVMEAEIGWAVRAYIQQNDSPSYVSEDHVKRGVSANEKIQQARRKLNHARHKYERIRAVRDAVAHKCRIIANMVAGAYKGI